MSFDFPFVRLFGNFVITLMHMIYIENHCPMMYMTSLSVCGMSCVERFAKRALPTMVYDLRQEIFSIQRA